MTAIRMCYPLPHDCAATAATLDKVHPGWQQIALDPAFRKWIAPQTGSESRGSHFTAAWWSERMLAFKDHQLDEKAKIRERDRAHSMATLEKEAQMTINPPVVLGNDATASILYRSHTLKAAELGAAFGGMVEKRFVAYDSDGNLCVKSEAVPTSKLYRDPAERGDVADALMYAVNAITAAEAKERGLMIDPNNRNRDKLARHAVGYSFGNKHFVRHSEGTTVEWSGEPRCVGEDEHHLHGAPRDNVFVMRHNEWRCLPGQAVLRFDGRLPAVGRGVVVLSHCTVHHGNDGPALLIDDRTGQIDLVVIEDVLRVVNLAGRETEFGPGHYKPAELNARVEKAARRSVREWSL